MSASKDPLYVTWFYRFLAICVVAMGVTLLGHFLQFKALLYSGIGIFILSWIGSVGMVPFGAWAQLKKWFGEDGVKLDDDGDQRSDRRNGLPRD